MVTIYDIANRVGVSHGTVSRVLNGADYRRPTFRARAEEIRRVAAELGYRPNASAQAMKRGNFNAISLMMSEMLGRSPLDERMLFGIQAAAQEHGLVLQLNGVRHAQLNDPAFVPDVLRKWHSDGLLINFHRDPPARLQELIDAYSVPAVWINIDVEQDAVRPDDVGAGRQAAEELIALGHRRVWYVEYSGRRGWVHYSEAARRVGYTQAMTSAGLEPVCIDRNHPDLKGESDWVRLFRSESRPTALITYGGSTNSMFPLAAAKAGLEVPRDLSLVTFGSGAIFCGVDFDYWRVPQEQMGRCGVAMLLRKVAEPREQLPVKLLPFERITGGTVDVPPLA